MGKSRDIYGESGGVPTVQNSGVSGAHESINATPASFGSQVGEAISGVGNEVDQMAQHFNQIVTEAKVNNDYANKYVPAAAQLRTQFDSLDGQDKVQGYDAYVNGLSDLNKQFTSSQPGFYGQKMMSSLVNKHIEGEIFGAKSELVRSQKNFSAQSTYDMLKANNTTAANNYNNPAIVDSVQQQNDSHILMQHIDVGHDPNNPQSAAIISTSQQVNNNDMATMMLNKAVQSGDSEGAATIRAKYASVMPGYQKLSVDNTLHEMSMKQISSAALSAIKQGQPIPPTVGVPAPQVQALVANTAKEYGVDHNNALTVLRIESSNGQNLGTRGTIGQTSYGKRADGSPKGRGFLGELKRPDGNVSTEISVGVNIGGKETEIPTLVPTLTKSEVDYLLSGQKPTPEIIKKAANHAKSRIDNGQSPFAEPKEAPLEDQARALTESLKTANIKATESLGRQAEPWEGYAVYQQGATGGPALLKAAQENPNMRAVDVLAPIYGDPKQALAAVKGNGGNVTMSAADFVDHIKQTYNDNARRSAIDIGDSDNPGEAIMKPHVETGSAVQPAATPKQALMNFDRNAPALLDRINSIPNYETRARIMESYNRDHTRMQDASKAYTDNLLNQAGQMAVDPKFTSMDQISPEMHAALAMDHPQTLEYMEKRAQTNLNKANGYSSEEVRNWGPGVNDIFANIHGPVDNPNRITNANQIYAMVNQPNGLTISGAERMVKELKGVDSPEKATDLETKKLFFEAAKKQITGSDQSKYLRDPKGDELNTNFFIAANAAIDKGAAEGKTIPQLLDSKSPDYIGKIIPQYIRPQAERDRDVVYQPTAPIPPKPGVISSAGDALKGAWNSATNYHDSTPSSPELGTEQQAFIKEAQKNNWSRDKFYEEAEKRGISRKKLEVPLAE